MSKTKKDRPEAILTIRVGDLRKSGVNDYLIRQWLEDIARWANRTAKQVSKNHKAYADTFRARFYG